VNVEKAREKLARFLNESEAQQSRFMLSFNYPEGIRYIHFSGFTVRDSKGVEIGRGQILQDRTREYEIDKMKTSLISTVSHELRTPLASIKSYASTLLADDINWEEKSQREFLGVISRDADRLSDIIDNLLDMSRIEAGSLTLSKTACDLENIIVRGVERADSRSNRHIKIDIKPDLPPVYVDAYRIETVVRNLVDNAFKYSDESSPVFIRVTNEKDFAIVRIEDQGPGIPPTKIDQIFESFIRLDNGLARRKPGLGLGLAICRGFVNANGGEIWVEPQQIGTCFAFSIPLVSIEKLGDLFHG
jgi:signal transduction histidine kinase